MKPKTTIPCAALLAVLGVLSACKQAGTPGSSDMAAAPASDSTNDAMSTTPAETAAPTAMQDAATAVDDMAADMAGAQSGSGVAADASAMATGTGTPFASMDANADGGIGKDELVPTDMLYQHFSAADADGNGVLSEAEVNRHNADMAATPAQ